MESPALDTWNKYGVSIGTWGRDRAVSIGIVLADDHSSVRSMVRIILASQTRFRLKGEASDGDSAVALVGRERPSVAIVDIGLPGRCGLDSTREIRERFPSLQVLMVSAHNHCVYV